MRGEKAKRCSLHCTSLSKCSNLGLKKWPKQTWLYFNLMINKMRISKLHIESFRGIPDVLDIDFTNNQGQALSTIIYGDNGTGKSSIVDAIEFVLQSRIEREQTIKNKKWPSAISKKHENPRDSIITIQFDNGEKYERGIKVVYKGERISYVRTDETPVHNFDIVPIVLRRNDIMTYNIISGTERQVLFFKFIYKTNIKEKNIQKEAHLEISPEVESLNEEKIHKKKQQEKLKRTLAKKLGINPNRMSISTKEAIDLAIKRNVVKFNGRPNQRTYNRTIVSQEEYNEIQRIANALVDYNLEIKLINSAIGNLTNTSSDKAQERIQKNIEILKKASKYLTHAFNQISTIDYIEKFNLMFGNDTAVSLDIIIKLKNGLITTPSGIFSEANYDLMILLLYISVIRVGVENGQEKVLVLDDVLQSVDTQIRNKFITYILKELHDWQIIITAHDRLWLNQLRFLFANCNHKYMELQINNWSFEYGPTIHANRTKLYDNSLEVAIKSGNSTLMASMAGLMLERICQNLSIELAIDIKRKRDDKYTIGDLWGGVRKQLKKSQELENLMNEINSSLYIRNLLGSHYNEWALSLSDQEIREFAYNVQKLYERTFCPHCLTWVSVMNSTEIVVAQCNCSFTSILKKQK